VLGVEFFYGWIDRPGEGGDGDNVFNAVGNQFTTEGELGDESDIKLACITPGMALILVDKPLPRGFQIN